MAYREDEQLDIAAYGVVGLSLVAGLLGAYLAVRNPQFYTRADLQMAHSAGESDLPVPAEFRDARGRILGVLLSALGMSGVCLASSLATGDPKTIEPATVAIDADADADASEPEAIASVVEECQQMLETFIADNPIIRAAVSARSLIPWGDQGAGKSLIASQIVTWRQIRRGDFVIVADPHYHHDRENQLYASADVVLSSADEIRQRLPKLMADALATPIKQNGRKVTERVTIVCDEFSNWHTLYGLGDVASQVVYSASQDLRKSILNLVLVAHGTTKGMLGGEDMESGRTGRLLDQSVVMKLEVDDSLDGDDDDPKWTGRGDMSARGAAYEGGTRVKFHLPAMLGPAVYPRQIAGYFTAAALECRPTDPKPAVAPPTIEQQLAAAAERLASQTASAAAPPATPFVSEPESGAVLNGRQSDWDVLYEIERADAFCNWLVRHQYSAGQEITIARLRDNWGKHHFADTAELIAFLATVNGLGLGRFDDALKPKCWKLKIGAEAIFLPESAEA